MAVARRNTNPGHLDRRQYVVAQRDREGVSLLADLYCFVLRWGIDILCHGPDVSATLDETVRRFRSGMDNDLKGVRGPASVDGTKPCFSPFYEDVSEGRSSLPPDHHSDPQDPQTGVYRPVAPPQWR